MPLNILLLLMPGLLSGQIFYAFFMTGDVSVSKRILDALLFTFVIYLIVSMFGTWEPLAQVKSAENSLEYLFSTNLYAILISLVAVIFVPVFVGFVYYNDHVHKILRKLGITTKTSRGNTWNDAFLTQDRYVVITMKDGRRIRGYPSMFSTDPDEGFVYLYNPAWVNDDKDADEDPDYFESNCHGMLLNRENMDLIEFTLDSGEVLTDK